MPITKRNDDPAWRNTILSLDILCQKIASHPEAWVDRSLWEEVARIRDWMEKYGEEEWGIDEQRSEGTAK